MSPLLTPCIFTFTKDVGYTALPAVEAYLLEHSIYHFTSLSLPVKQQELAFHVFFAPVSHLQKSFYNMKAGTIVMSTKPYTSMSHI